MKTMLSDIQLGIINTKKVSQSLLKETDMPTNIGRHTDKQRQTHRQTQELEEKKKRWRRACNDLCTVMNSSFMARM